MVTEFVLKFLILSVVFNTTVLKFSIILCHKMANFVHLFITRFVEYQVFHFQDIYYIIVIHAPACNY